jgi:hypothetical protein
MDPLERIEQAFLQLTFAIKLMCYIELGKVNKDEFDVGTTISLTRRNIGLRGRCFISYDDIILGAQNNYVITIGFFFIALDNSLNDAKISNDPDDVSHDGTLRTLIYMIRSAFAHDMMSPRWEVRGKYRRVLALRMSREIEINLYKLHGQPFKDSDIGGADTFFDLKEAVQDLVKRKLNECRTSLSQGD